MEIRGLGMTYKKFYCGKLDAPVLEHIDAAHKKEMKRLIEAIHQGAWTEKQKKRQKSSILSNIALYKSLTGQGLSKNEAKELVRAYAFYRAEKAHRLLKALFNVPGFFRLFRFFMKKGMAGDEIWQSNVLSNDRRCYRVDVLKCLWADTCGFFECPELCEIFCLCDHIVFGHIKGFAFERSQTLGMSGEKCDFCFINEKGKKS